MPATRFAATVSYDGTAFVGSQIQPNGRTVQAELEAAAGALFGVPVRVALAGRTDSGVHAVGQVAALTAETRLDAATVGRALNAHLPEDVAVRHVRPVPEDFDPRRWARRRWYRYTVWNGETRAPLMRERAWFVEGDLDVGAMGRGADALLGRRDFLACSGQLEEGRTSVRTILKAGWRREGCALLFDIEADAFLPQMVRRLTGALVRIGRKPLELEEFVRLLEQADAGTIGPTAPAHGLCLQRVEYDEGYSV
ncbi:MAG: tRNA pseudouridine(38-40) synthase TruA [Dehalococcoidia bacterium]